MRRTELEEPCHFLEEVSAWTAAEGTDGKEKKVAKGNVKWFSEKKGYGFITQEDGGDDVFVHHKNIVMEGFRKLVEGQNVTYEVQESEKGLQAVNVEVV